MHTVDNPIVPETDTPETVIPEAVTPETDAPEADVPETAVPEAEEQPEGDPQGLELSQCIYHGIVFESPEAVALAKSEEARLEDVMRNISRDSLESIDAAIAQVNTSPSPIKKLYLDTLHSFRMDVVNSDCTFRGILYESPAHMEHAKQVYSWALGIYNSLDRTDENSIKGAREHLLTANHKATEEVIALLDKLLVELEIQKRTVDGIRFETLEQADEARQELSEIRAILSGIHTDDEPAMLEAKEKLSQCTTPVRDKYLQQLTQLLTDYDIKKRTFRDKLYETREEVALLEQEAARVREILTGMNQTSEPSMLEAKAALETLTTELKEAPLASVTKLLEEYDVRLRTFNGVLYETREEAITTAQEYQTAISIRQQVNPENEQSILDAQAAMRTLTTSVKDAHLKALQEMWASFDLKQRSFGNIVFDTREEAQLARATYQEFMNRFNTMDLEQSANLVLLEQYIAETLQEKLRDYATGLINNVRMIHTRVSYIYRTDAAINMATQKKESAELYQFIEETIPLMNQYRLRTEAMEALKKKHFASLNMGKKIWSFFKK